MAVNIDVFVMDNAPADNAAVKKMFQIRDVLNVCNFGRMMPIFLKPKRVGG